MSTAKIPSSTQEGKKPTPKRRAIIFLAIVSFLNTVGFTIVGPVTPFMTRQYISNGNDLALTVAWMLSIYGICQLIAAPGLGLLSDRYGRRPVLFACLIGSAIGYLLFGLGGALWILFLSRIIDGLTGGNFSVLFAYVADITEPEERGAYFGIFGGISGVGFILGPAIGGLLAGISYSTPFFVAAAVTALNLLWGFFFLPESLKKEHRITAIRVRDLNPLSQLGTVFKIANLRWLLLAAFFYAFPFASLQANLTILMKDSLGWNPTQAGLVATLVGVVDILAQGVLLGKLLPIFGDVKLSIGSLILVAISYILLGAVAIIASPLILIAGVILFAGAGGLVENGLRGLTSQAVGPSQQGLVGGAGQSMQSLAMIVGPIVGGIFYAQFGHASPYWSGASIIGLAILCIVLALPALRAHRAKTGAELTPDLSKVET
ncbi:tetracycline resistance MFS efflux pump [Dictyobacter alpinus]|uniref:Tetracycline resistance MFS efflux pump n=1 Tax=Dictyobacter alpinus TaxID=2014873 RepID=A0A402BJX4_9CHLR|nr:MFS transporter [Dictyobacter alpinus]GCE31649.1 tetracycline resistance MFS efflux pump [Dictyobacter alpinus]